MRSYITTKKISTASKSVILSYKRRKGTNAKLFKKTLRSCCYPAGYLSYDISEETKILVDIYCTKQGRQPHPDLLGRIAKSNDTERLLELYVEMYLQSIISIYSMELLTTKIASDPILAFIFERIVSGSRHIQILLGACLREYGYKYGVDKLYLDVCKGEKVDHRKPIQILQILSYFVQNLRRSQQVDILKILIDEIAETL